MASCADHRETEIEDAAVIRELAFEANTKYINAEYRSGFLTSILILLRICARSFLNRNSASNKEYWKLAGEVLAFSVFKNEKTVIDEHTRRSGVNWSRVQIDIRRLTGLDFYTVIKAGIVRSPRFFYQLVKHYGFGALRRMAYPFLGYSIYCHLRTKLANADVKGVVVTTNTVHPVSLAIHYAARASGWQTIYLEHAMTPKFIARDRGYTQLLLRSSHTKEMFVERGVDRRTISVLDYWNLRTYPAPVDARVIRSVGFAVNSLDGLEDTEYVVSRLAKIGTRCEIRVHDADKRFAAFRALGRKFGVAISSAAGSDITEFIRRHNVVIVGNSAVLLDCLRANVPAIYFWAGPPEIYDYYGLATYMRFPSARNREELLKLLEPAGTAS
jgi:hypothetical protein